MFNPPLIYQLSSAFMVNVWFLFDFFFSGINWSLIQLRYSLIHQANQTTSFRLLISHSKPKFIATYSLLHFWLFICWIQFAAFFNWIECLQSNLWNQQWIRNELSQKSEGKLCKRIEESNLKLLNLMNETKTFGNE